MGTIFELALCSFPNDRFFLGFDPQPGSRAERPGSSLSPFFESPFSGASPTSFRQAQEFRSLAEVRACLDTAWPTFAKVSAAAAREWPLVFTEADPQEFAQDFARIQQEIAAGRLQKAVPATFERSPQALRDSLTIDAFHAWAVDRLLRQWAALDAVHRAQLYLYARIDADFALLGLSPEILLSNADAPGSPDFRTMALAGSAPLDRSNAEFLADPKERAEHAWVVEDLRARLQEIGGEVVTEALRVETYPKLKHLKTPLRWRVGEGFDPARAVGQLHPTAALGLKPRSAANSEFFRSLKSSDSRGFLGAPLSFWDGRGLFHSVVAIRGVERRGHEVVVGAGCGIVAASQLEREWQECALKRCSIKTLFGWI